MLLGLVVLLITFALIRVFRGVHRRLPALVSFEVGGSKHIGINAIGAPSPHAPVAAPLPILHGVVEAIVREAIVEKCPDTPIHDDDEEEEPQGVRQEVAEQERSFLLARPHRAGDGGCGGPRDV